MSGNITLINATPSNWHLASQNASQTVQFTFPNDIAAGSVVSIPVDWSRTAASNVDTGDVAYEIAGTSGKFNIKADKTDEPSITVTIDGLDTKANADGASIPLGFVENGSVHWILSGDDKAYNSINVPSDWMQKNLDSLGPRKLRHVCMPGSHDAGMSALGSKTAFATKSNVLTQAWSIGDQLKAGSRFFDIRPVISSGDFLTGHYSYTNDFLKWQGANGQSLKDIVNDINSFTRDNGELIILDLSHAYDTDNNYTPFSQNQWNQLFTTLASLNARFLNPKKASVLQDLTINDFIGNSNASVVIVAEINESNKSFKVDHKKFPHVVSLSQFGGIFNKYADTDKLSQMESDQISKMHANRKIEGTSPTDGFFLLSWTLTQDLKDIVGGESSSIYDLAATAYEPLFQTGFEAMSPISYPNVLFVDLFGSGISPDADSSTDTNKDDGSSSSGGGGLGGLLGSIGLSKRKEELQVVRRRPGLTRGRAGRRKDRNISKRASFVPGETAPVSDMAALAMAVNALAGKNPVVVPT